MRLLAVAALVALLAVPHASAITQDDLRAELSDAFVAVSRAEGAGGDVSGLAERLGAAAALIDSGKPADLSQAESLIGEVARDAPLVESAGVQRINTRYIVTGASLVILGGAGVLVWFRGSDWFWRLWLRGKAGWRVERA